MRLERQSTSIMEKSVATDNPLLITAYETEFRRIGEKRLTINERAAKSGQPTASFDETCRDACQFLANPWKLWASDSLEDRRILLRLTLAGRLPYCQNEGYRTAIPALPFKVLADISNMKFEMVPPAGLEPARPIGQQILSLACLPVPPRRHLG